MEMPRARECAKSLSRSMVVWRRAASRAESASLSRKKLRNMIASVGTTMEAKTAARYAPCFRPLPKVRWISGDGGFFMPTVYQKKRTRSSGPSARFPRLLPLRLLGLLHLLRLRGRLAVRLPDEDMEGAAFLDGADQALLLELDQAPAHPGERLARHPFLGDVDRGARQVQGLLPPVAAADRGAVAGAADAVLIGARPDERGDLGPVSVGLADGLELAVQEPLGPRARVPIQLGVAGVVAPDRIEVVGRGIVDRHQEVRRDEPLEVAAVLQPGQVVGVRGPVVAHLRRFAAPEGGGGGAAPRPTLAFPAGVGLVDEGRADDGEREEAGKELHGRPPKAGPTAHVYHGPQPFRHPRRWGTLHAYALQ